MCPAVTEPCDVIVVGGGLVGATVALGIARIGRKVRLFDRTQPRPRPPPRARVANYGCFDMDIRNVAVSPASRVLLIELGVWESLAPAAINSMHVWEEQGTGSIDFSAADVAASALGWLIENHPTVEALWALLENEDAVTICVGDSLEAVEPAAGQVTLHTSQDAYPAQLLIGVDGAMSRVRELVTTELEVQRTGHHALATLVRTELPHSGTALQRFLLDGPLALLPSREPNVSSVVWSQSESSVQARLNLDDAQFCREIGKAIEHRLGEVLEVDDRHTFPLHQQLVRRFNPAPRVLLIGDAAHVLHPLAGLGANVGFEDVRALLARLRSMPLGQDAGEARLWRPFARQRRARAQLMLRVMAGFRTVYAQDDPLLQWLRNVGVSALNRAVPLKRQLMAEALGLGPLAEP